MKIHLAFCFILFLAGLLQPRCGYSQKIGIDSTIAALTTDSTGAAGAAPFRGSIGLDARFSGGNIKQALIRANASLLIEGKNFLINPNVLFTRNVIFGRKLESDVFSFLVIKAWQRARLFPVATFLYENSLVRSIDLRYMSGVGAGWNIGDKEPAHLELIQLVVYDRTRFLSNKEFGYEGLRTHTSLIGKYVLLQKRLSVEHRLFYSVLINDITNQRLRTFFTLKVPVVKGFSLTANLDYIFESIVDERRARQNFVTTGGVSYQFM